MAKGKDANDVLIEKKKKGGVPYLKEVDEDFYVANENDLYLSEMNEKHAFICTVGGRPMILCWVYNEVYKKNIIEFRSPESIISQYNNKEITIEGKRGKETTTLGKWWLAHPDRKEYSTVIFDPSERSGHVKNRESDSDKDGYWNLWEGFGVKEEKGIWTRTKRHIWKVLCNKNRFKFKYFIKWLAWAIQNPGIRAGVAVALKGKKGAGKGFIFTQLQQIFGRHGMSISNGEHLTGKHNAHLMLTSFLFADEAYYPGDKGIEGVLKQLITEPCLTIEPKFQNTRLSINCLHIGISTNADWVVPASSDERRYFINEVDDLYAKNGKMEKQRNDYFTLLWNEMDHGGREAMLYDLKRINLIDKDNKLWNPRDDIPETAEMGRQRLISMGKKEKHIQLFLDTGRFPGYYSTEKQYMVTATDLFEYLDRLDPGNKIATRVKSELLQKLGAKRARDNNTRMWVFPPLHTMKEKFNEEICPVEWDDYDDWEVDKRTRI